MRDMASGWPLTLPDPAPVEQTSHVIRPLSPPRFKGAPCRYDGNARPGCKGLCVVHLSVAIGRFFEAVLFAVARSVGMVAAAMILALVALVALATLLRAVWRRRPRK